MKAVIEIEYKYKDGKITRYTNNSVRIKIHNYIKWIYDINKKDLKAKRVITKFLKAV